MRALDTAARVNNAGRLRVLSQRAALQFCLVQVGADAQRKSDELAATVDAFEAALSALQSGDPSQGVLPTPGTVTIARLDRVCAHWTEIAPVLKSAAGGELASAEEVLMLAKVSDVMLREMNVAVESDIPLQ